MADPLSITSGVLAVVVAALQSSTLLYQTVSSFQNNNRAIRELKEELESLDSVLNSLRETTIEAEADFKALELPLRRCSKACQDFRVVIEKCSARSGGPRTSFRDWAKLRYLGEDIVGFKNMLAGYKSTIAIALGDANMRKTSITLNVLNEYKTLIADTTADLEEHLKQIDDKLGNSAHGTRLSHEDKVQRQQIEEERESALKCLEICEGVLKHISQVYPAIAADTPTAPSGGYHEALAVLNGVPSARAATADTFQICKERLMTTAAQLQKHLVHINSQLQASSPSQFAGVTEQVHELDGIREEMDSIKQCISICMQASTRANQERTNVFEDVSIADDSHQILVSTIGDLISAKRVIAGSRSSQWLGQMSDESLQLLSRQHGGAVTEDTP